jgi:predicted O-methyltransferase YrrM
VYDNDVSIGQACSVSKGPKPALLLFLLTRAFKPMKVIELGTNVGISSAYIGAALSINGQGGRMTTLDASPYRQRLAKELHRNTEIDNISYAEGLFLDTLVPALEDLGSVDLAFIDGHHQYQPTLDYFEEILKFSDSGAVIVFDDIRWSKGMKQAWSRIQSDDRLDLVVDLRSIGVCALRQQDTSPRFVSDPIYLS